MQNRFRRNRQSVFLLMEYKKAKAKARRVIRNAKKTSWLEFLSVFNHRTPMSTLWGILRKFSHKTKVHRPFPVLQNNNEMVDEPSEVADLFGQFFSEMSSVTNYSDSFLRNETVIRETIPDFDIGRIEDYNKVFTMNELRDAIKSSGSTSVGPDKIHYDFFRHLEERQLVELLAFYNYIWTDEVFPEAWRHSYIIPILKPGKDPKLVSSYRPIQLTSCLCKLLERMVGRRLSWWLEKNELLSRYQSAFRKRKSTVDHLIRIESEVREGFIYHSSTLAVFLDIKSAYNMVSPTVLLMKMYRMGFRGHLMHFVQAYLFNRTFQVRCGVLSDRWQQEYGLVQGGVISPLLFNIMINDVFDDLSPGISKAIYADDCAIWAQGRDIPNLFATIQRALNRLQEWSDNNGLTFSAIKSKALLFRRGVRRVQMVNLPSLVIGNENIPLVEQVKYLGVLLDTKLNFISHVEYIKSRAVKRMSILKCVAGKNFGADRVILLGMYKSLIRPILDYAGVILDGPGTLVVESLEKVQNSCLRLVTGALRTSPIKSLQIETNVIPLKLRRWDLSLRFFHKILEDVNHPCFDLMDYDARRHLYDDLSERYLKRISGFPISYRLLIISQQLHYDKPERIVRVNSHFPPWIMNGIKTKLLFCEEKKALNDTEIQAKFREFVASHVGFRFLYTDGSKQNESVSCAFTINSAYVSYKLSKGLSVYTAELVAIWEAIKYVNTRRINKSVVCTDSKSAIQALTASSYDHPILTEIADIYHRIVQAGYECILLWIPGHRGIRGNERADYWANRAHDKPDMTLVPTGHREYVPYIRRCIKEFFNQTWQNYRLTFLKTVKPVAEYWGSCSRKVRREEVVLSRMRLGHTLLTHGHIIGRNPAPVCITCQCPVTVQHIIVDCVLYREARRRLSDLCRGCDVNLNVKSVLGNDQPLVTDGLMTFLRECDLLRKL